eukprot:CAMPEP_0183565082 /NCGR_PEP_ID=MMETSP0371-20130417/107544_1 /TAXON_ID=268820 /ORGANISM="Peridinium aciculiferum, Strain PAER-2" /LENGTH=42 /DNA_ID= /DNA_START= /DNA_END= /DNA_ORIENTATION=
MKKYVCCPLEQEDDPGSESRTQISAVESKGRTMPMVLEGELS